MEFLNSMFISHADMTCISCGHGRKITISQDCCDAFICVIQKKNETKLNASEAKVSQA